MKRKTWILITLICILHGAAAQAAEVVLDDIAEGIVKVSGYGQAAGEQVNLVVLNPGAELGEAGNDAALSQYVDAVPVAEDGSYSREIQLEGTAGQSGTYDIYVREPGDSAPVQFSVYWASADEMIQAAKAIVENQDTASIQQGKKALALDIDLINKTDLNLTAQHFARYLQENPILFDGNNDLQKAAEVQSQLKACALLAAYNKGISELAFLNDGQFRYNEITNMTGMDQEYDITAYSLYSTKLSDTGKKLVRDGLLGINAEDLTDVKRQFTDLVLYYGIGNHAVAGYNHVSEYITEANVRFAENVDKDQNPVKTYLGLTNPSSVNAEIVRNYGQMTLENYKAKIEELAKGSSGNDPAPGGGSGGSSGGGSSSPSAGNGIFAPNTGDKADPTSEQQPEGAFTDMQNAQWAKEAVEALAARGVISGYGDGRFGPGDFLTREQAARIICTYFEIPTGDGANTGFSDVAADAWYAPYVAGAKDAGVLYGVQENQFGIGAEITRQDLAVLIYRALGEPAPAAEAMFTDMDEIADYAKPAVLYLKEQGIINGYEDGTFLPGHFVTRAETAQMLFGISR